MLVFAAILYRERDSFSLLFKSRAQHESKRFLGFRQYYERQCEIQAVMFGIWISIANYGSTYPKPNGV